MFVLARALTYASLFVGILLVYLPSRILSRAGVTRPDVVGAPQIGGMVIAWAGAVVAIWCVFAFVVVGKGTPAPFDPPRRLVTRGPYRFVRNPMYIGAGLALAGACLYYQSLELLAFAGVLAVFTQIMVTLYEEPRLRRTFGAEYETYCHSVRRWWPRRPGR